MAPAFLSVNVGRKQAAVFFHQPDFFLPLQSFDVKLPAHRFLSGGKRFVVNELHGESRARVFGGSAAVVRRQAFFRIIRPAAAECTVGTFQQIGIVAVCPVVIQLFPLPFALRDMRFVMPVLLLL